MHHKSLDRFCSRSPSVVCWSISSNFRVITSAPTGESKCSIRASKVLGKLCYWSFIRESILAAMERRMLWRVIGSSVQRILANWLWSVMLTRTQSWTKETSSWRAWRESGSNSCNLTFCCWSCPCKPCFLNDISSHNNHDLLLHYGAAHMYASSVSLSQEKPWGVLGSVWMKQTFEIFINVYSLVRRLILSVSDPRAFRSWNRISLTNNL